MGLDIRKGHFLRTAGHKNPGSGKYYEKTFTTFVDKPTNPSFGFGTSTREKNYI